MVPGTAQRRGNQAGAAERLYENVRCGLYHVGATKGDVWLQDELPEQRPIMWVNEALVISPKWMVEHTRMHFGQYVARLLDSAEGELREHFEARFDFDTEKEG